jgi:hypothetical protein
MAAHGRRKLRGAGGDRNKSSKLQLIAALSWIIQIVAFSR